MARQRRERASRLRLEWNFWWFSRRLHWDRQPRRDCAKLLGFPTQPSDAREISFGAFGREWAGGGVSMKFYCADRSGHAFVESKIESGLDSAGTVQSVT